MAPHHIALYWMIATAAHLPVPVFDGDDLGRRNRVESVGVAAKAFDVDFILLGCKAPDDPDDGPFHINPEDGAFSVVGYPTYLARPACTTSETVRPSGMDAPSFHDRRSNSAAPRTTGCGLIPGRGRLLRAASPLETTQVMRC